MRQKGIALVHFYQLCIIPAHIGKVNTGVHAKPRLMIFIDNSDAQNFQLVQHFRYNSVNIYQVGLLNK